MKFQLPRKAVQIPVFLKGLVLSHIWSFLFLPEVVCYPQLLNFTSSDGPSFVHDAEVEYIYLCFYSASPSEYKHLNQKVFSVKEKQNSTLYYIKYFRFFSVL